MSTRPPLAWSENRLRVSVQSYTHPRAQGPTLRGVKLEFPGGCPHLLLGRSGTGKSTLLSLLLPGVTGRFDGEVHFECEGAPLTGVEVCSRGWVGLMSQTPALLPWSDVRANLRLPAELNDVLPEPTDAEIDEIIEAVDLPKSVLEKYPHELSFGMKQRVAFARAILYRPRFLFLDEVYTGLDVATISVIERFLADYIEQSGAVTIIVTHNLEVNADDSRRCLFLRRDGSIEQIPHGTPTDKIADRFRDELRNF